MKMYDQIIFLLPKFFKINSCSLFFILTAIALSLGDVGHRPVRADDGDVTIQRGGDAQSIFERLDKCAGEADTVTLHKVTTPKELLWSLQLAIVPEIVDFIPIYSYSCSERDTCQDVLDKLTKELKKMLVSSDWYIGVARNCGNGDGTDVRALPLSDENMQNIANFFQTDMAVKQNKNLYIVSSKSISGIDEDEKLWASADNKKLRWNPTIAAPKK